MTTIQFKHVLLIGRSSTIPITDTIEYLKNFLSSLNITVSIKHLIPYEDEKNYKLEQTDNNPIDLIVVIGGDGSLLHAAQYALSYNLPIIGVHRGRLGFLTDLPPDNTIELEQILQGNFVEQPRNFLSIKHINCDNQTTTEYALNDAVILPGDAIHMIEFDTSVNQQLLYEHRASGMIVSTPTGSTAYALSAGGSILHPTLDAMILVPMFPHTLTSRPIVVKGDSIVEIAMKSSNNFTPYLSCDGRDKTKIQIGSTLTITKHTQKLRLIHPNNYNYFERLHDRLGWERRSKRK
jgi:NAD+ kinase